MANILIIDDEPLVCEMLEMTVSRAGHKVKTACDGSVAIEILQAKKYDLVITDIIMPEKDGLEAITEFKKIDPDMQIIAISGGSRIGNVDFLQVATKLGASHAFYKPVEHSKLINAIDSCLADLCA